VEDLRQANPDTPLPRHFASWDPVIAGIIAARDGNDDARAAVEEHLADRMDSPDWSRLAAVLRDILDAGAGASIPGDLGDIDAAITHRALAALTGDTVPFQLWPAIEFTGLIGRMVSAATGDAGSADQMAGVLARMDADAELAPLAGVLRRILNGERAPALARGLDPVAATIVIAVLFHVPPAPPAAGS
jgi:hypothetical protein